MQGTGIATAEPRTKYTKGAETAAAVSPPPELPARKQLINSRFKRGTRLTAGDLDSSAHHE